MRISVQDCYATVTLGPRESFTVTALDRLVNGEGYARLGMWVFESEPHYVLNAHVAPLDAPS